MAQTILILLAVSLDVFSFGISLGVKKQNLSAPKALYFTLVSTLLFVIPFSLSFVFAKFVPAHVCYLINGSVLLALGFVYFQVYVLKNFITPPKSSKKRPNLPQTQNKQENYHSTSKHGNLSLKWLTFYTIPVNLDAFFTALLVGFSMGNYFFVLATYTIFTFVSVFISNKIAINLSNKIKFDLSFVSGILFLILGALKLLEGLGL